MFSRCLTVKVSCSSASEIPSNEKLLWQVAWLSDSERHLLDIKKAYEDDGTYPIDLPREEDARQKIAAKIGKFPIKKKGFFKREHMQTMFSLHLLLCSNEQSVTHSAIPDEIHYFSEFFFSPQFYGLRKNASVHHFSAFF